MVNEVVSLDVNRDEASFCAVVDGDGEVIDFQRLPYITRRKNSWNKEEREQKEADLQKVKDFILSKKPHVIAVGAESRDAVSIIDDLKFVIGELEQEHQIPPINVELVDTELGRVFSNSKKAEVMHVCPSLLPSISLSHLFVLLSGRLSVHRSVHPSIALSIHPSIRPSFSFLIYR